MRPNSTIDNLERRERRLGKLSRWESSNETSLADQIMFDSRLRRYDALFAVVGLPTLENLRIFDAGCANGKWLTICCERWGAQSSNCCGSDRREIHWSKWKKNNPDTEIKFVHRPVQEVELEASSFDVVHQSMMFSSILSPTARGRAAKVLWRLLRPGGVLISYDFWLNPLNSDTVGIRGVDLRRLFPEGREVYNRSLTLAPPVGRRLTLLGKSTAMGLERMRILNSHLLIALRRPVGN